MRKLYTERLVLREFDLEDLDAFYEFGKNKNVGINAGWEPFRNKREAEDILYSYMHMDLLWAIALKEDNKLIGTIGLYNDTKRDTDDVRMLGYAIAEAYWGKGYAAEASKEVMKYGFDKLWLELISAYHYPGNERSRRVIEKLDFMFEGQLRMAGTMWNGEPVDYLCYSITKKEFYL